MTKKITKGGHDFNISKASVLNGIKYGFFIESINTIFVSPAVYSFLDEDLEMIKKHLRIINMPQVAGEDKFDNLEDWVRSLIRSNEDIFCASLMKKNKEK